ncbi:hypothetical protein MMB232_00725 [Brevundimonas subvibrioides]
MGEKLIGRRERAKFFDVQRFTRNRGFTNAAPFDNPGSSRNGLMNRKISF